MHKLSPTFIIRRSAEESRDSLKSSSPSLTGSHRNLKDKRHEKFDEHFLDQPQRRRLVSFAGLHANSFRWGWKPADYLKFTSDAFHLQWRWTRHLRRGSWARTCVSRSRQTLSRRLWLIRNFMSFSRIQSNLSGGIGFLRRVVWRGKDFHRFSPIHRQIGSICGAYRGPCEHPDDPGDIVRAILRNLRAAKSWLCVHEDPSDGDLRRVLVHRRAVH